jgi:anti-anti-sigma factor
VFVADGLPVLVLTSGFNRVSTEKLCAIIGRRITRADADTVRRLTGYAIGGIPPLAHDTPARVLMDPHLLDYEVVWAAAGTPHAVFGIAPEELQRITGAEVCDLTELTSAWATISAPMMHLRERRSGAVVVLEIGGNVTQDDADAVREAVARQLDSGEKQIVLDVGELHHLDSAALGAIVASQIRAGKAGTALKLANVNKRLEDILVMTRLVTVFESFDSTDAAIASFAGR